MLAAALPVAALVRNPDGSVPALATRLLLALQPEVAEIGWGLARTPASLRAEAVGVLFQAGIAFRTLFVAALLEGAVAAAPALVGGLIAGLAGAQLGRAGPHRRRYSRAREPERMFIRTFSQPEPPSR